MSLWFCCWITFVFREYNGQGCLLRPVSLWPFSASTFPFGFRSRPPPVPPSLSRECPARSFKDGPFPLPFFSCSRCRVVVACCPSGARRGRLVGRVVHRHGHAGKFRIHPGNREGSGGVHHPRSNFDKSWDMHMAFVIIFVKSVTFAWSV